ncbi:MAG: type II secretion system protein N [Burkholderiaceae bacterium]
MSQTMAQERADWSWTWRVVAIVVGLVVMIAVVVATAPANWLAHFLAARTQGRVLLADARGTIWSGNAVLALGSSTVVENNEPQNEARDATEGSTRLALPGRVRWTLQIVRTLAPVLHLTHDGVLLQPVEVRYANGDLAIAAGAAVLPTSMLRLAGTPLNTLRPEGRSEVRWGATRIDARGRLIGAGTVRIGDLALAVSPVKPLGDYRVTWASDANGLTWQIATEQGPLELKGAGSVAGRRVQMRVTAKPAADAPAAVVARLKSLLDTIGTHGGTEAVMEMGSRG